MAAGKPWLLWLTLMAAAVLPAQAQAQEVFYVHTDALGTVVAVTDANGDVVKRSEYEPYGRVLNRPVTNGPGYTGHVEDAATGLTYMQQRYYDPVIGRFLSVDPVTAYGTGDYRLFTRYAYAFNNPYKFTDPHGRTATCNQNSCTIESNSALEAIVDYGTVGLVIARRLLENAIVRSESNQPEVSPDAPSDLVGEQDDRSGQQGGRHNSGPLSSDNGGTGDAATDFGGLTGGQSGPAAEGSNYPAGTLVGDNGIALRPGTEASGPRIDIPSQGGKPHETLHYPKPNPGK